MDPVRFGGDVRLLRRRRGWSQERLAEAIGRSRWVISEIEHGRGDRLATALLATIVAALGGQLSVRILYQGEGLDRLRDRAHAQVIDAVVRDLVANGWQVATEVSFSVFGERGVIDILAFHPPTGALLVVEVKTVVPDVGGMLATLDRKVRLAPDIARERGWAVRSVSRLLVMRDTATARRRVAEHASIFAAAFPTRTIGVRRWLRAPDGQLNGLRFLSDAGPTRDRARPGPVERPRTRRPRTVGRRDEA